MNLQMIDTRRRMRYLAGTFVAMVLSATVGMGAAAWPGEAAVTGSPLETADSNLAQSGDAQPGFVIFY